jgi:hypothetical protein
VKVKIAAMIASLKYIFASSLTPPTIEQKTMKQTKATKQVKTVHWKKRVYTLPRQYVRYIAKKKSSRR